MVPSTLHSTRTAPWLVLAIGSVTDLRSVRITHHAKHVQNMKPQNDGIFSLHYLRNRANLANYFGYTDVL